MTQELTPKQKRTEIKRLLGFLEPTSVDMFKRMYSFHDLEKDINDVVDDMPAKQLNWALTQCQNTYHRIFTLLKYD